MQLSKFTDYAYRSLIYLAKNREKLCTVEELASNANASEHHIKKVIHKLAKTEYITSTKGRNGGLTLGLDPKDINLGEVLLLTEDNLNIFECFTNHNECPLANGGCKLKSISRKALTNFVDEFSNYTLEDLL